MGGVYRQSVGCSNGSTLKALRGFFDVQGAVSDALTLPYFAAAAWYDSAVALCVSIAFVAKTVPFLAILRRYHKMLPAELQSKDLEVLFICVHSTEFSLSLLGLSLPFTPPLLAAGAAAGSRGLYN